MQTPPHGGDEPQTMVGHQQKTACQGKRGVTASRGNTAPFTIIRIADALRFDHKTERTYGSRLAARKGMGGMAQRTGNLCERELNVKAGRRGYSAEGWIEQFYRTGKVLGGESSPLRFVLEIQGYRT